MTIKARSRKRIGCSKIGFKREVYSNTIIPQETRKTQNRQTNFTPKATGKRISLKNQKKERNHKDPSRNKGKRNERNKSKD